MKKLSLLIISFILLTQAWVAAAQEDPNRPKVQFRQLVDGESVEGSFEGSMTAQVYVFSATAGDVVSISMSAAEGSSLDSYLVLMGPRGEILAIDDDSAGNLNAEIKDITLTGDGAHFVLATTFLYILFAEGEELTEELTYEISASGFNRPADDAVALQFFSGRIEIGQSQEGVINTAEPIYYYTFPAEEGQVVDVAVSSDDFDTLVYLFDPEGRRIAINDDADGTNSRVEGVELPMDGLYMAFATNLFFNLPDLFEGGEFEISVEASR
jgi:hypothetical protein